MLTKYPALKKYPNGDPVWYKVVNVDCQPLLPLLPQLTEYPIEPESEVGRRITTIHGDFHSGNMVVRPNGELLAIDLELTYVAWAVIDLAYYLENCCISRAAHRIFAERYLKSSGLPSSPTHVDDLLFDIEIGKFMCPLIGHQWIDIINQLEVSGYDGSVTKEFMKIWQTNKQQYRQEIINQGLFETIARHPTPAFTAAMEKWGAHFSHLNVRWRTGYELEEKIFHLKGHPNECIEGMKEGQAMYKDLNGFFGSMQFERIEEGHYWMGSDTHRSHFHNFNDSFSADGKFSFDYSGGKKIVPPYRAFSLSCELSFKKFNDGNWCCKVKTWNVRQIQPGKDVTDSFLEGYNGFLGVFKDKWCTEGDFFAGENSCCSIF